MAESEMAKKLIAWTKKADKLIQRTRKNVNEAKEIVETARELGDELKNIKGD